MELNRKGGEVLIIYPLAGAVIRVNKADFAPFNALRHNCIAVILACDIGAGAFYFFYRLINTPVTLFKLLRLGAHSERQQLMTEANAENRLFTYEVLYYLYLKEVFGGIARSV